jgi:hypothetical protein
LIPVTHPADRQALADLLTALEMTVVYPDAEHLAMAREELLKNSGPWVNDGATYSPAEDA